MVKFLQFVWAHFWSHFDNIADGIVATVVFTVAGAILATLWHYLGEGVRFRWSRFICTVWRYITWRRKILLWIDTDLLTVERLADHLNKQLQAPPAGQLRNSRVHVMRLPREILLYPMKPSIVAAIILINTDVSKLSADDKIRELIENQLLKYLRHGGGIVGCHDVIYRRARNERLQGAFGGKIDGFSILKGKPIEYVRNKDHEDHPIAKELPEEFALMDGEILATNEWPADAQVLFRSTETPDPHDLVVAREYLTGRLVWLNSCDHQDPLCASVRTPQDNFVKLLSASIQWVARC